MKALKRKLSAARRKHKALRASFVERLEAARDALSEEDARALVLGILQDDLRAEVDRRVVAHRQEIVAALENWWSKYRETLGQIEGERDGARNRLAGYLRGLGYA